MEWGTAAHNDAALFLHLGGEHGIGLQLVYVAQNELLVYRRIGLALSEANGVSWERYSTIREIAII